MGIVRSALAALAAAASASLHGTSLNPDESVCMTWFVFFLCQWPVARLWDGSHIALFSVFTTLHTSSSRMSLFFVTQKGLCKLIFGCEDPRSESEKEGNDDTAAWSCCGTPCSVFCDKLECAFTLKEFCTFVSQLYTRDKLVKQPKRL